MRTITIFIISFFSCIFLRGQSTSGDDSYYPPSPNASNLLKYANFPVNLYTGTPVIDLPITEIKGKKFTVPVTLSYHASGNKVQDVAGWVGLGFSINAGGVITRIVRGIPDELPNGYCGTNNIGEKANQTISADYLSKVNNKTYDSEPDLFYYNFLGHTGKFVLDAGGLTTLTPYSNLKISPGICPISTGGWIITDENGVAYTFGRDVTSQETTTSDSKSYISSWYLSEIKPSLGNEIQFSYTANTSPVTYTYYIQNNSLLVYTSSTITSGCTTITDDGTTTDKNITLLVNNPVYLSQIKTSLGQIDFIPSLVNREDLPGAKYLDQINFKSYDLNLVASYKFGYSYFKSDNCSTELCKRLKLESVSQVAGLNQLKLYSFEYNGTNLPSRDSHMTDHWGFYNSNAYSSKIPAVTDDSSPCGGFHPGADKSADSLRSKANTLTKIYRATGGYTEFVYSGHRSLDVNGNNQLVGGVRIRIINECENNNNCKSTYYYYTKSENPLLSSGVVGDLPKYWFRSAIQSIFGYATLYDYLIRNSQSLTNLFDLNGYHIGYSNVRVSSGNGYVWNSYTNNPLHSDIPPVQSSYTVSQSTNVSDPTGVASNIFPYTPSTSLAPERGLLIKKSFYNKDSKILKEEIYNYNFDRATVNSIPAVKLGLRLQNELASYYILGRYFVNSKFYTLDNVTSTIYDPSDPGNDAKKVTTTTNYSYVPVHPTGQIDIAMDLLPRRIAQTLPNGDVLTIENKYGIDYSIPNNSPPPQPEAIGILLLTHDNRNPLIESITYLTKYSVAKYMLSGTLNTFKEYPSGSGKVYLWEKRKLKVGAYPLLPGFSWSTRTTQGAFTYTKAQYKTTFTANDYDTYGNLISSTGEDGVTSTYTWSNSSTLLESQTINTNTNAPALEHKKSFLYKPLVGVTTITDANGLSMNYNYDSYNRLMLVFDVDGKIVNRYRYNYINNNEALTSSMSYSGLLVTNSTITFSTPLETRDQGPITYIWDFGDGTTPITGTSYQKSYAFTLPGTYTVKLVKSSAEYGSATSTVVVTISPSATVSICAKGPVRVEYCQGTGDVYNAAYGTCGTGTSTTLTATPGGGCGTLTYEWQLLGSSGTWSTFGTGATVAAPAGFTNKVYGTYSIRCIVYDSCGVTVTSSTFNLYVLNLC